MLINNAWKFKLWIHVGDLLEKYQEYIYMLQIIYANHTNYLIKYLSGNFKDQRICPCAVRQNDKVIRVLKLYWRFEKNIL